MCYRSPMKRWIIIITALMSMVPMASSQVSAPESEAGKQTMGADETEIRKIPDNWMRFYNAGDAAEVTALYAEDGYYLSAHVLAHGRQAIQAYWEKGIKGGGHMDFIKLLKVQHDGALAYCAGTYQATNAGVTVDGRILIVLRKINGRWLIAAHETVVRDQPI